MLQGGGRDASALFHSAHLSPHVAKQVLPRYRIGVLSSRDEDDTADTVGDDEFYTVVKERVRLHLRGKNTRDHPLEYVHVGASLLVTALSYWMVFVWGWWWMLPVFSFALSQIGVQVMHSGNHAALSRYGMVNVAAECSLDVIGGCSMTWRTSHNLGHHINVNSEADPDPFSGVPFLRLHPSSPHRPWHRFQHLYAWVLYSIHLFSWRAHDWIGLAEWWMMAEKQRLMHVSKGEIVWQVGARLILFPLWLFVVPVWNLGLGYGVTLAVAHLCLASLILSLFFVVAHLSTDAAFARDVKRPADWARSQVASSVNFGCDSWLVNALFGGLNLQIEHHLFPCLAFPLLREVHPIVKQVCLEFGVPYHELPSYWSALHKHYAHLKRMGAER